MSDITNQERQENRARYHQQKVYKAIVATREAIHDAKKDGIAIGTVGDYDFETPLAEIKRVGGFYFNPGKGKYSDTSKNGSEPPQVVEEIDY